MKLLKSLTLPKMGYLGRMGYLTVNVCSCNSISSYFFFSEFIEHDYDFLKNKMKIVSKQHYIFKEATAVYKARFMQLKY